MLHRVATGERAVATCTPVSGNAYSEGDVNFPAGFTSQFVCRLQLISRGLDDLSLQGSDSNIRGFFTAELVRHLPQQPAPAAFWFRTMVASLQSEAMSHT